MKRDSRFETLRIISMFMILLFHYQYFSQPWRLSGHHSLSFYFLPSAYLELGKLGVYLFVMITGYFVGNSQWTLQKGVHKAGRVWSETIFYAILIFVIAYLCGQIPNPKMELITSIMPFTHDLYWFVDAYIVLILLVHYLNIVLVHINRNDFKCLIIIVSVFASLLSPINSTIFTNEIQFGFIIPAYLIGAYFRKYHISFQIPLLKAMVYYFIAMVGASILYFVGHTSYINFFFFGIFQLISASYIFNFVMQRKSFGNAGINVIAKTVFASYLITDNEIVRRLLWSAKLFHDHACSTLQMGIIAIFIVVFIMILCTLIDVLRAGLFSFLKRVLYFLRKKDSC
ncbi:acyltransferase family protein [Limosilactobacillus sp.]|uniref:acyltransferase family protein n=1 Tax=Limosilactobacillus sp. TaxID=2773925 RepID=UPI00345E13A2